MIQKENELNTINSVSTKVGESNNINNLSNSNSLYSNPNIDNNIDIQNNNDINNKNKKKVLNFDITEYSVLTFDKNTNKMKSKEIKQLSNGYYLIIDMDDKISILDNDFQLIFSENQNKVQEITYGKISKNNISFDICRNESDNKSTDKSDNKSNNKNIYRYTLDLEQKDKLYKKLLYQLDMPFNNYFKLNNGKNEYLIVGEDGIYRLNLPLETDSNEKEKGPLDIAKYNSFIRINNNLYGFTTNDIYVKGENVLKIYNVNEKKFSNNIEPYSFTTTNNGLYLINLGDNYKILLCACSAYRCHNKNGILIQKIIGKDMNFSQPVFVDTDDFEVTCFCCIKNKTNSQFFLVGGFDNEKGSGSIRLYKISFNRNKYDEDVIIKYIQDAVEDFNFSNPEQITEQQISSDNERLTTEEEEDIDETQSFDGIIYTIMISKENEREIIVGCLPGNIYKFLLPSNDNYFNYYQDKIIET